MKGQRNRSAFVSTVLMMTVASLVVSGCSISSSEQQNKLKNDFKHEQLVESEQRVSANHFITLESPKRIAAKLKYPVNDFTDTLSENEIESLNRKILSIDKEGILQIGIVIVPTTGSIDIFDYAMSVANIWQLGSPQYNNGLLILVAKNDKRLYLLTGLDIEDTLTDRKVKSVIDDEITPAFSQNDYALRLEKGNDALVAQITH